MKIISIRNFPATACAALLISIIASLNPVGLALAADPCSNPTISGTDSGEILIGTSKDDVISGRGGNDIICGGPGDDRITIAQASPRSFVFAMDGDDIVHGGSDTDKCTGDPDRIHEC